MSDEQLEHYLKVALEVAKKAGRVVANAFESPINVHIKSCNTDLVTDTDRAVEELIIKDISTAFPDHKFIGEETAATGVSYKLTDSPTWIIDPIDGTTNFVHRIPIIAICIGLAINKKLLLGIVYNPITNELFSAQSGKGAFKNGFPIHGSKTKELKEAVISMSLGIHNKSELEGGYLDIAIENQKRAILAEIRGNRGLGSAAMNMVYTAQGSIDAYVEYGLHSWDMAAAAVIVKEAGCRIMDPSGKDFNVLHRKVLCAGTPELADQFSKLLKDVEFKPEESD